MTSLHHDELVYLADGAIRLRVEESDGDGVECEVEVGGTLSSHKGMNIPGATVRAATDGVLLCIRREEVEAKLAGDPTFELRLDKVISKFAPRRRRSDHSTAGDGGAPEIPAAFIPQVDDVVRSLRDLLDY